MRKFTFIAEFGGGTYISQYKALDLIKALNNWADRLDVDIFSEKVICKIQAKVKDSDFFPVPVKTVDNVWCSTYTISRSLLILNIVETV